MSHTVIPAEGSSWEAESKGFLKPKSLRSFWAIKGDQGGVVCSSVAECLPSMYKALDYISSSKHTHKYLNRCVGDGGMDTWMDGWRDSKTK